MKRAGPAQSRVNRSLVAESFVAKSSVALAFAVLGLLGQAGVVLAQPQAAADVVETCRRIGDPRPPASDRPSPAERRSLKGCDSEALYYGEQGPADPAKARKCAFIEAEGNDAGAIGGAVILMQVYANGAGVARNLTLATAYACNLDGAVAELEGRVRHLQKLAASSAQGPFDFCDDITSGLAEGLCQARDSRRAAPGRAARLAKILAGLPQSAQARYPALAKAFDAFVTAHADGEVDQSGTARAALVIAEEDSVRRQFLKDFERLAARRWPAASTADARAADAALNLAYRKALKSLAAGDAGTTVTPPDVRAAQRAWIAYRDAFIGFAALAAPEVSADAVAARLTRLRLADLEGLAN